MTLHLGVADVAYAATDTTIPAPRVTKKRRIIRASAKRLAREFQSGPAGKPAETTGDVAEALEARYHVMETFFDLHGDEVAALMAASMAGALETQALGGPRPEDPLAEAMADVGEMFREFLDREELAGRVAGVPTKAALEGTSPRYKSGRGPRRPSFEYSGLYHDSFMAWVD